MKRWTSFSFKQEPKDDPEEQPTTEQSKGSSSIEVKSDGQQP